MTTETLVKSVTWRGLSGRRYRYYIYAIGSKFNPVPGNYVFAREDSPGRYVPVYVGETENLSERFDNHHKMPCIRREGATQIHVHSTDHGDAKRQTEAHDLVKKWQPTCNE